MTPGPLELLLIFTVVLILFGAQNLPKIARSLGKTLEEFRRAAHEVTTEIINADEDDDPRAYIPPSQQTPPEVPSVGQHESPEVDEVVEEEAEEDDDAQA